MTKNRLGFSLVEVVVALGVFVAGVVGAIALLSTTTDSASRSRNALTAGRVAESAAAIIRTASWSEGTGWLAENRDDPIYVTREGDRLGLREDVPLAEAFFELRFERHAELSPEAEDETAGVVVGRLQVSWPVRLAEDRAVAMADRETLTLNVAVTR